MRSGGRPQPKKGDDANELHLHHKQRHCDIWESDVRERAVAAACRHASLIQRLGRVSLRHNPVNRAPPRRRPRTHGGPAPVEKISRIGGGSDARVWKLIGPPVGRPICCQAARAVTTHNDVGGLAESVTQDSGRYHRGEVNAATKVQGHCGVGDVGSVGESSAVQRRRHGAIATTKRPAVAV